MALVLARSRAVKTDISTCSVELGRAHDIVRVKVSELSSLATADQLLKDSNAIKIRVLECANDLNAVNHALARAISSLRETEISLADALDVLAITEAALASSESEKRRAELLSLRDLTTGLPNRRMFDDRLEQALSMADRHGWTLAVMFLDLDRFKNVNDLLGHAAGDEVLKEVARRLMTHTRDEDTACRNGGDEFLFLLVNPQGRENIARIVNAILASTAVPVNTGKLDVVIKASIGIAIYPENGTHADDLIQNADTAMYRAKDEKSGHAFFSPLH